MAGTKAGFHFNDWPLMNGSIVPAIFSLEAQFASNPLLNFHGKHCKYTFFHRILAYMLTAYIVYFYIQLKSSNIIAQSRYKYLLALLIIQVCLGILTLVLHVPIALAALHQLFAIALFLQTLLIRYAVKNETIN